MLKDKEFWLVAGGLSLAFLLYWFAGYPLFKEERLVMFLVISIMTGNLIYYIRYARKGGEIFLRSIPGLKAVEEAVGRSTEMGKSVL